MDHAMDHFKREIIEVTFGDLTDRQHKMLDKAHRLFHLKHSGPLPFAIQVAMVILLEEMEEVEEVKKPRTKQKPVAINKVT